MQHYWILVKVCVAESAPRYAVQTSVQTHIESHTNAHAASHTHVNNAESSARGRKKKKKNYPKRSQKQAGKNLQLGYVREGEMKMKQYLLKPACDGSRVGHLQKLARSIQSSSATASSQSPVCV